MKRRTFIKAVVASGLVVGTGGVAWLLGSKKQGVFSIDAIVRQLDELRDRQLSSSGDWGVAKIFAHLAQSIEFSMTGYPQHKPALFKHTIGKLAFSIFSARKAMSHSLSEPIPGAPTLQENTDFHAALAHLRSVLLTFRDYDGKLHAHFAYGGLSKAEYTLAHIIHIHNHMQQISAADGESRV